MKQSIGKFPANWETGKDSQHTFDYFGSIGKCLPIPTLFILLIGRNCCRVTTLDSENIITVYSCCCPYFLKKLTVMIGKSL